MDYMCNITTLKLHCLYMFLCALTYFYLYVEPIIEILRGGVKENIKSKILTTHDQVF